MSEMMITWLGHSCFKVESRGYAVILDPYEDGSVKGLGPLRATADEVLCSHEHGDHNAARLIRLREGGTSPFSVKVLYTYHDDVKGAKRGPNKIHILDDGDFRVAHLGDLGCMPTEAELRALQDLDAVMVPIGGFFTIDARQAKEIVDLIAPRIVIPMHYRSEAFGFDVLGTLDRYTSLCDNVVYYDTNKLALTEDLKPQTAVLKAGRE